MDSGAEKAEPPCVWELSVFPLTEALWHAGKGGQRERGVGSGMSRGDGVQASV